MTASMRLVSSRSSLRSLVAIAFATIDRPVRVRLEGDFTFFAAFGTNGLMHLTVFSI
jgi:hypothetical protein